MRFSYIDRRIAFENRNGGGKEQMSTGVHKILDLWGKGGARAQLRSTPLEAFLRMLVSFSHLKFKK